MFLPWVLIITVISSYPSTSQIAFESKDLCENAKTEIHESWVQKHNYGPESMIPIVLTCVKVLDQGSK